MIRKKGQTGPVTGPDFPIPKKRVSYDGSTCPSLLISTSPSAITRKNRNVPCRERSQSSREMAVACTIARSREISSRNSAASSAGDARIWEANRTRTNATSPAAMIVKWYSISRSQPFIWIFPRSRAREIASGRARCGLGARLMPHTSGVYGEPGRHRPARGRPVPRLPAA